MVAWCEDLIWLGETGHLTGMAGHETDEEPYDDRRPIAVGLFILERAAMRILLICAAFPPFGKGGGPASSELLAHGLVNRGHAVRVLTVAGQDATDVQNGIEVKTIKSLNVYWDYWKPNPLAAKVAWHVLENFNPYALTRMRLEMREFSPDIVATIGIENVNVATWLAARLEGIPVSHMIYSYFLMCW